MTLSKTPTGGESPAPPQTLCAAESFEDDSQVGKLGSKLETCWGKLEQPRWNQIGPS